MKQRILITGGSGFIGTNLIHELMKDDRYELLNIDIKPAKTEEISTITKECDIRDFDNLNSVVTVFNPDYIVHLAARTDLNGKTIDDYSSNTVGVKNLIDIAKTLPNLKKILITSSMLVCKAGYQPKDEYDFCPSTIYGESKVETENITRAANLECDWALLRPTSIWGPWFDVPYRNFFDMVRSHRYFHIGRKSCTKTYGYVGNAVYQIIKILFSDTSTHPQKVFYLGDSPTNIEEWANEIASQENHVVYRVPFWAIKCAAKFGDILTGFFGIGFPMTSFRLKNMTTDNVINLKNTDNIAPSRPYTRLDGVKHTIEWLKTGN